MLPCPQCRIQGKRFLGSERFCYRSKTIDCARELERKRLAEEIPLSPAARDAFRLFTLCATQWRWGFDFPAGLDYDVMLRLAALPGIEIEVTANVLRLVRVLESEEIDYLLTERKKPQK